MKLVDTVALIGYLNPRDREHRRSVHHMERVASDEEVFVPVTSLVEADLVMKVRGYSDSERETSWGALESAVPRAKVVSNTVSSVRAAVELQRTGMDYFDSLIAALAKEAGSRVITTDASIKDIVETEW
ncbi:MAG: PIN domain-containing protein [Nitrososphaerota archaeon]|nr:PIN domain-containing protein [Nitrososphaerota archaeon]MDG7024409.1 PIN domain-containing protein [Nitrososphaerota archaeon]